MQQKKIDSTQKIPLCCYSQLSSTNLTARSLVAQGFNLPFAVRADEQTAGRGQWGRVWQSDRGGLYLSLAVALDLTLEEVFYLTLISSWGVAEIFNRKAIPVKLKWPNDLLLDGLKLGGIKIETGSTQTKVTQVIIGIGINWQNETPLNGINLVAYPSIESLDQLTEMTLDGLVLGIETYSSLQMKGSLPFYLKYCCSIGKAVEINGQMATVVGVDEKGKLVVLLSSPGARCEISCSPGMISLGYY